jgi:hypothetical protein
MAAGDLLPFECGLRGTLPALLPESAALHAAIRSIEQSNGGALLEMGRYL